MQRKESADELPPSSGAAMPHIPSKTILPFSTTYLCASGVSAAAEDKAEEQIGR